MNFLNGWIGHIVTIVIFASFVEMIMPHSDIKRFVKMIMGLIIILIILSPLGGLMQGHIGDGINVFNDNVQTSFAGWEDIRSKGLQLQKSNMEAAKGTYQTVLEKQVKGFVLSQQNVKDAQVQIVLQPQLDDPAHQIQYMKIGITFGEDVLEEKESMQNIKPVTIPAVEFKGKEKGEGENAEERQDIFTKRVEKAIINFFDLNSDQVKVYRIDE